MPKWSQGRIALVGDAAHCVSLVAGQGSALAMTGAFVLAGELAKASGRHTEAFANYEGILRGFIDAKQRGAERFARAFAPKTLGAISAQSNHKGGSNSGIRTDYIRPQYCR